MATLDDRIYALILRLTERTGKDLRWADSPKENAFVATMPTGNTVEIDSAGGGRSGRYPYTLIVQDPFGGEVERIQSNGPEEELGPWDIPLRDLYRAARASARNIDGTINSMLESLGVNPDQVAPMEDSESATDDDIPF